MSVSCCYGLLDGLNSLVMTVGYIANGGTPDNVGKILNRYYSNPKKVMSLLKLGDIYQLGVFLSNGDGVKSETKEGFNKYTVSYKRDLKKETCFNTRTFKDISSSLNVLNQFSVRYLYLLDYSANDRTICEWLVYRIEVVDGLLECRFMNRLGNRSR